MVHFIRCYIGACKYDLNYSYDVHAWSSDKVDRYISNFKPEVFSTAVMYSEKYNRNEEAKYELKQYWIERYIT